MTSPDVSAPGACLASIQPYCQSGGQRRGVPLVICAPSGAGKTTLTARLRAEFPLTFSISCTTRSPREGEVDGRDYYFLDRTEFGRRHKSGFFAETAEVHGSLYGTPLPFVEEILGAGKDMLFDIDVQGAAQLRTTLPGAVLVFLFPPSLAILEERLRCRGTESEEVIARRMVNARMEIQQARWFHAWVVNDTVEKAYEALRAVYVTATLTPCLQPQLPAEILGNNYV